MERFGGVCGCDPGFLVRFATQCRLLMNAPLIRYSRARRRDTTKQRFSRGWSDLLLRVVSCRREQKVRLGSPREARSRTVVPAGGQAVARVVCGVGYLFELPLRSGSADNATLVHPPGAPEGRCHERGHFRGRTAKPLTVKTRMNESSASHCFHSQTQSGKIPYGQFRPNTRSSPTEFLRRLRAAKTHIR